MSSPPRPHGLGPALSQRAEQRLALEPRLLQSIEVLALPAAELEAYLRDAYERNEALALEDVPPALPSRRADAAATQRHAEWFEALEGPAGDPRALLVAQVEHAEVGPTERAWVLLLVDCLDDDGLLREDDEALLALAARHGLAGGERELGRAIAALQTLEPRGVGARDATEALLLQLDPQDPDYPVLCALVERHLVDLERNRLPRVAREEGLDLARLEVLLARLAALSPRPFAGLVDRGAPVLAPDLVLEWDGDRWHLEAVRGSLPRVGLDPRVARIADDPDQPAAVRRHLRSRVRDARWLIESLERRETTLVRVAAAALERQPRFFERGPSGLEPLTMTEVAEALGLHTSTVSRAVAGKSVQTPFGVLALRDLFCREASEGSRRSRGEAADLVRELVAAEDPSAPLSDEELVRELARRGVEVARRTVAKHRTELGIPSSYRRRRHGPGNER